MKNAEWDEEVEGETPALTVTVELFDSVRQMRLTIDGPATEGRSQSWLDSEDQRSLTDWFVGSLARLKASA